jgi:hypothetical protein
MLRIKVAHASFVLIMIDSRAVWFSSKGFQLRRVTQMSIANRTEIEVESELNLFPELIELPNRATSSFASY